MREYEILIEENSLGATRPVKLPMDIPISMILPKIVEELRLPKSDLFGNSLTYVFHHATSGRILPSEQTLEASGILPGMCLKLDSLQPDLVATPVMSHSMNAVASPLPLENHDLYTSETLADGALFSVYTPDQFTSKVELENKQRPHKSRRAFLATCGVVLGAGGIGVAYAAYRGALHPEFLKTILPHQSSTQPKSQPKKTPPPQKITVAPQFTAKVRMVFNVHQNTVRAIAWSPLGNILASGADDAHVFIWDDQGNVQQDLHHPASVHALALSPDQATVATGSNNQVAFWSTLTGKRIALATHPHTQTVTSLAWTTKMRSRLSRLQRISLQWSGIHITFSLY